MKDYIKYSLGILVVVGIFVISIYFNKNAEFGGADVAGQDAILSIKPDYEPWYQPFWTPKPETESMLFALQAAIGAGVIGYFIGYNRGLKKSEVKKKKS